MERYDIDIAKWAREFSVEGPVKAITLREGPFSKPSPDEEQGAELLQIELFARISRKGVELEPYTEKDEMIIAKHCAKMQLLGVPARAILREPPRPGLPFLPTAGRPH